MCVRRGDEWLLEERAIDGAICPPGGKIESGQNMYQLDRISIQTQVTVYTETALEAVIRESREELEFKICVRSVWCEPLCSSRKAASKLTCGG